ncbi:MAG: glutamine-hydrolyzing GMP synthase, partial [Candidatus Sungbacteria bacterium]|nr:glutamine-hydrolyzing GMP synthase [Candidatus Sungbacteria bacterium]
VAAFADDARKIYGVQFHPEVSQTQFGERIFGNFLRLASSYKRSSRINVRNLIAKAKMAIGKERALIALSGGVDSSVAAVLVARAVGRRLLAVYVDTGLMRSGETKQIQKTFRRFPFRLRTIFAQSRFYRALRGVTDPEDKRRRIGKLFIKIFEEEARRFRASVLVQGTIYSDRIESGSTKYSSRIKSHHNVGGLPKSLKIRLYEPLAEFYKDEVRRISTRLGLPAEINQRKVFPGPGLAIRIIGEVKPEKVRIVREADMIIQEELQHSKYFKKIWMTFPILLSIKSVGIQGDERSYKYPIVLRILESQDAMTARAAEIPFAILQRISTRITNEIEEVNRVLYDLTSKPPATMEWE